MVVKYLCLGAAMGALAAGCETNAAETMCAQRAVLTCELLFGCCDASERLRLLDLDDLRFSPARFDHIGELLQLGVVEGEIDQAACERAATTACALTTAALIQAEDDGRVEFDSEAGDACLEPVRAAVSACDVTRLAAIERQPAPEACMHVVIGKVPDDGACYTAAECATAGATCLRLASPPTEGPSVVELTGTCVPPGSEGASCPGLACGAGLYCDGGTCHATAQLGETCSARPCSAGHVCDGVCRSPPAEGESCAAHGTCAAGFFCDGTTCRSSAAEVHDYCTGA